jgi:integrase
MKSSIDPRRMVRGASARGQGERPARARSWRRTPLGAAINKVHGRHGKADKHHWKAELQAIIDANNWAHSVLAKGVSFKTRDDRAYFLFSMFKTLWYVLTPRMTVMPRNFALNHVQPLVDHWVDEQNLAPSTVRLYLSYVRTFCEWIGKRGMVHEPERFVADASRVKRVYAAKDDRSWEAHGVIAADKIAEMEAICPYAGCQAGLADAYALRPKEAFMLRPHLAERDGYLMVSTEEDTDRYVACAQLEVKRGTKGGRVRWVPIDTPKKRAALERAKRLVGHTGAHMGVPGRSLAWTRRHFYTVCEKVGLTRKQLGVTPYGARHQYACDRYQECASEPPPVRGGKPIDRELDKVARSQVARELGHSRESVTRAYLGGVLKARRSAGVLPSAAPSAISSAQPSAVAAEGADEKVRDILIGEAK